MENGKIYCLKVFNRKENSDFLQRTSKSMLFILMGISCHPFDRFSQMDFKKDEPENDFVYATVQANLE